MPVWRRATTAVGIILLNITFSSLPHLCRAWGGIRNRVLFHAFSTRNTAYCRGLPADTAPRIKAMKRAASADMSIGTADTSPTPQKKIKGVIFYHRDSLFMVQPTGSHGWGIPKGGVEPGESLETAARREFIEETGITLDPARPLKFLRGSGDAIKGGKKIHAFLYEGEGSEVYLGSNIIESGFRAGQPENCAGRFMTIEEAKRCVHKNQLKLIELYDIFYKYRKDT